MYEKILFGFTPYSGLWGVVDSKFVYDYVNSDLFNKLFDFYSKILWDKNIHYLNELGTLEIVKFQKFYKIQYPAEINSPIDCYDNDKKCSLILALTQYYSDEYEDSVKFQHKRNLYYLSLILNKEILDYKELQEKDIKQIANSHIVLYENLYEAYHNSNNTINLPTVLNNLIPKDLYKSSINLIKKTGKISVPILQRKFNINYSEAIQIMEQLEKEGIVSKLNKNGQRKVLS